MKHTCPKCSHTWEESSANQAKGGKARWKKTTKAQRSASAKKAADARWAKKRAAKKKPA